MIRIDVLVSGGRINFQALIDGIAKGIIKNGQIVTVVSNHYNVYAQERAKNCHIPSMAISRKSYSTNNEFNEAILEHMHENKVDLIVMAGFLAVDNDAKYNRLLFLLN